MSQEVVDAYTGKSDTIHYSFALRQHIGSAMLSGALTHLVVVVDVNAPENSSLFGVSGHLCVRAVGRGLGPAWNDGAMSNSGNFTVIYIGSLAIYSQVNQR